MTDWIAQTPVAKGGELVWRPAFRWTWKSTLGGGRTEMDLSGIHAGRPESGQRFRQPDGNLARRGITPWICPLVPRSGPRSPTGGDSDLDMKVDVGSGRIVVTLAERQLRRGQAGFWVQVRSRWSCLKVWRCRCVGIPGPGSVSVPSGFVRTSGGENVVGDGGAWETEGFDQF